MREEKDNKNEVTLIPRAISKISRKFKIMLLKYKIYYMFGKERINRNMPFYIRNVISKWSGRRNITLCKEILS